MTWILLRKGNLYRETKSLLIAAILRTNIKAKIDISQQSCEY